MYIEGGDSFECAGAAVTAIYESHRRDRRYEVDAHGVAEFGPHQILRGFIPWCAVKGIEFAHDPRHRHLRWSVTSADGSRIRPKLEYTNSVECYNAAVCAWRACVPHACREHYRWVYRRTRRAFGLLHLLWVIPALGFYGFFGLAYALRAEVELGAIRAASTSIAILYVLCIVHTLIFAKFLRLGFDGWYARVEASFTEPRTEASVSEPTKAVPDRSFALFRWLLPAPVTASGDTAISDEECRSFRRWDGAAVLWLLLAAILGYAWYLGMTWAASLFHDEAVSALFVIRTSPIAWALPALFLGLISSLIPLDLLYRALLRERYRRYVRHSNERAGFDGKRLMVCFAILVLVGSTVFFLAGATNFTRFTEAGIEIQHPFAFRPTFYGYNRVRFIERWATAQAPSGNKLAHPHLVIVFDDRTSWNSREGLRVPVRGIDDKIAQLVSERSKRPIIKQQ